MAHAQVLQSLPGPTRPPEVCRREQHPSFILSQVSLESRCQPGVSSLSTCHWPPTAFYGYCFSHLSSHYHELTPYKTYLSRIGHPRKARHGCAQGCLDQICWYVIYYTGSGTPLLILALPRSGRCARCPDQVLRHLQGRHPRQA